MGGCGELRRSICRRCPTRVRCYRVSPRPKQYGVSASDKRPLLDVVAAGLRAGGARVLESPSPAIAPFRYAIETPRGERLQLVAYLFRANKYRQRQRPEDEHRFQIKYGNDFYHYHYL